MDEEKTTAEELTEETEKTENTEETVKNEEIEKKEGFFSKAWKKVQKSVNDSILEEKIRVAFEKTHQSYTIYSKDELFPCNVSGSMENGNELVVFGTHDVKLNAVVINGNEKAYYVTAVSSATVSSIVDGVTYEREGTRLVLDENVEEVNVVKAGKRYFIYKGC